MASIYSHRFLACPDGSSQTYTVPAGMVAVVRCVTAACDTGTNQAYAVYLSSPRVYFVAATFAGTGAAGLNAYTHTYDLRVVLQGGDVLGATAPTGVSISVSGYLFST